MNAYNPEIYWSKVAHRIDDRSDGSVIAGDDEPYYVYKRVKFIEMLDDLDVKGKDVLEVGSGPGGNLLHLNSQNAKSLTGVDISEKMIELSRRNCPDSIKFFKTDGAEFPLSYGQFDIVFSATVLQHITDEVMLRSVIGEMCRVAGSKVVLHERIEKEIKGDELNYGRPIAWYTQFFENNNYELVSSRFLNVNISYYVCGAIRKTFDSKDRNEGEPVSRLSSIFQKVVLPVTKVLDRVFKAKRGLAKLEFVRK